MVAVQEVCGIKDQVHSQVSNKELIMKSTVEHIEEIQEILETQQALGNLLARIHRDGGHYQQKHGTRKAIEDAEKIVCNFFYRDNTEQVTSRDGSKVDRAIALPLELLTSDGRVLKVNTWIPAVDTRGDVPITVDMNVTVEMGE